MIDDRSSASSTSSLTIRAGWSSGTKSSTEGGKRNTWSACQSRKVLPVIANHPECCPVFIALKPYSINCMKLPERIFLGQAPSGWGLLRRLAEVRSRLPIWGGRFPRVLMRVQLRTALFQRLIIASAGCTRMKFWNPALTTSVE